MLLRSLLYNFTSSSTLPANSANWRHTELSRAFVPVGAVVGAYGASILMPTSNLDLDLQQSLSQHKSGPDRPSRYTYTYITPNITRFILS